MSACVALGSFVAACGDASDASVTDDSAEQKRAEKRGSSQENAPLGAPSPETGLPSGGRDFVVERPVADTIYAVSDIHGGVERFVDLLVAWKLIPEPPAPYAGARWSGGTATLLVLGDLLDKGPAALETIELLQALEGRAREAGGEVIVLLGNHEAEFFANPSNKKASDDEGINRELARQGIAPADFVKDPRGAWLERRPAAARVGAWFFSHAGDSQGVGLKDLRNALAQGYAGGGFSHDVFIGGRSILESREWYGKNGKNAVKNAEALGVEHIVFGHDPSAIGRKGSIANIGGIVFRIDCGMTPSVDYSDGALLRVRHDGGREVAEELLVDGRTRELWRAP